MLGLQGKKKIKPLSEEIPLGKNKNLQKVTGLRRMMRRLGRNARTPEKKG